MASLRWQEVADGVFVRHHRELDLNVGLVVGADRCLVIDTRSSLVQGEELTRAVREVTPLPWTLVNTHAHYDHCFGNASFLPTDIWGHVRCAAMLKDHGDLQREVTVRTLRRHDQGALADEIAGAMIVAPDHTFHTEVVLDLGGRTVHLAHLGRGHTDNDVVVRPAETQVVFAGDLVEEGAPPAFEDAFPLDWPDTLARVLAMAPEVVVPGHGTIVDADFVRQQAADIARSAETARQAHAAGRRIDEAVADVPFPEPAAQAALRRAYRQLDGQPPYDPPEVVRASLGLAG